MNKINIGDTLKIVKEDPNSLEHNRIGPVTNIQQLADGMIAYTLRINVNHGGNEVETLCIVREGEYQLLEKYKPTSMSLDDIVFST